jgi:nucleotide-binding universal stress UspA family protein
MTIDRTAPVVVGIDGSTAGNKAMEWAADEAQRRGASLVVVHAGDVEQRSALTLGTAAMVEAEVYGYGTTLLEDAVATLVYRNPSVPVSTRLIAERPARALIDESETAGLLVLGRGNESRLGAFLLGSIAHRVLAHAVCPTVVIGEQCHTDGSTVVVGVSMSDGGQTAMRFACEEAALRGATVIGVRCWSDATLVPAGFVYMMPEALQRWQAAEQHILETWVAQAEHEFPGLIVKGRLSNLPIESAIKDASHRAGLIVVGTRRGLDESLPRLGPIASWAIYHADCPLAITAHHVRAKVREPVHAEPIAAAEPATS